MLESQKLIVGKVILYLVVLGLCFVHPVFVAALLILFVWDVGMHHPGWRSDPSIVEKVSDLRKHEKSLEEYHHLHKRYVADCPSCQKQQKQTPQSSDSSHEPN